MKLLEGNVFTTVCHSVRGDYDVTSCLAAWSHVLFGVCDVSFCLVPCSLKKGLRGWGGGVGACFESMQNVIQETQAKQMFYEHTEYKIYNLIATLFL